jgi:hypothetical protein
MSLFINAIKGRGKPTEDTQGYVGRHYLDMDSGIEYICVRVDNHDTHKPTLSNPHDFVKVDTFVAETKYVWEKYDGGGSCDCPDVEEIDAIKVAAETGLIDPITAEDGSIYTDEKGKTYIL